MVEFLPEDMEWRDEGCELYPRCLECPLPRCIEEEPRLRQRLKLEWRAERMRELRRQGKGTAEIARMFGVSVRTVQRSLRKVKVT
jgi:DNA invertase Pin-like site-specific DNA recombinase